MNEQDPSTAPTTTALVDRRRKTGKVSPSIRSALMLAVTLSLVPALAIIIWTGLEHGAHLAENARAETLRQVESFAEIQARITGSTHQMLRTLTALPAFKELDLEQMAKILQSVHESNQEYLNLTAVDTRGIVIASSLLQLGMELGDRSHFRNALDTGCFVSGRYMINMIDSTPAIAFALPIIDRYGKVAGALAAIIKMDRYNTLFENFSLPKESILGFLDADGVRLYFYPPKATNQVGNAIKASVWNGIKAGDESGLLVDTGSDGIDRFFAFKKLRLEASAEPYMYVVYALPTADSSMLNQSILRRSILLMILVAAFAMASAGLISKRLFGARLALIIATTQLLRRGDLRARVGFDDDRSDLGQIATALDLMAGTIERRDADMAHDARMLAASLAEKEILLQEVHHRVKNNLQLILSLLSLQESEAISPSEFKEAMENRIKTMSMVHEMLYESDNFASIDLGSYTRRLVELGTCAADYPIDVSVDADEAMCSLDTAVPFGLMLNELVTNACKHAFRGRRGGSLHVTLRIAEGSGLLEVQDDGPGLQAEFSISESSSLGLRLAHGLAQQLNGTLGWNDGPGARFTAKFKVNASREP